VTECPKCGAPTVETEFTRSCLWFDDPRTSPVALKDGATFPGHCAYRVWLPGGREAHEAEQRVSGAGLGDDWDRDLVRRLRREGGTLDEIALYFEFLYQYPVTKGMVALWEMQEA
jgi:hypothetical protein